MIDKNISWAEKYRPKTLDDLIFPNEKWKGVIKTWLDNEKCDGNIALFGPGGLGKSTLAKIIINSIIKSPADLKVFKSRSVSEVDELAGFISSKPYASKKKIVMIDEVDRLSNQSQTELKEKYTEQYQDNVTIIIASNYPYKIDPFLLQRFVYKIDFSILDPGLVYTRISNILESEGCRFNETELKNWISHNIQYGLRHLINQLQLSSAMNDKLIIFDDMNINQDLNTRVLLLIQNIINNLLNCSDGRLKRLAFLTPVSSELIGSDWVELTQLLTNNASINYEELLLKLNDSIHFLPVKYILNRYIEELPTKKFPHFHLISFVSDVMKCILELQY